VIGIVVDSNSQMPTDLAERLGIEVVALTVTVDGDEYLEGVDLDADRFYQFWKGDRAPHVTTSQPAPGAFVDVYQRLAARGVDEILSVHISAELSGTLNSARLAAEAVDIPVRLVDSGTASFGISCCAWAAADAIAAGASIEDATGVAARQAAELGTAFVVGVPTLADESGRLMGLQIAATTGDALPVLGLVNGDYVVLDTVSTVADAVGSIAAYARRRPCRVRRPRIAVGTSDASGAAVSAALTAELADDPTIGEIVQYRIGPSVGAYTGPGTSGLFVF
jgi:DegV family protein with EDD domain